MKVFETDPVRTSSFTPWQWSYLLKNMLGKSIFVKVFVLQSIPPEPRLCLIVCRNNYSGTRRSYLICSSILLCPQLHVTNYTNMQSLKGSNHCRIWLTCLEGCKHIVLKAVDEITHMLHEHKFNSFTSKISLVILLTVCHTILVMLVLRIWYWIN